MEMTQLLSITGKQDYRFKPGDDVLCFSQYLLHRGKCLDQRKTQDNDSEYLIHLNNFSSNWDQWLNDNNVLATTKSNLEIMELFERIFKDYYKKCEYDDNEVDDYGESSSTNTLFLDQKEPIEGGENVQVMEVNNKKEGETNDDEDSVYNKIIVYIDFNEEAAVNSHFERSFI